MPQTKPFVATTSWEEAVLKAITVLKRKAGMEVADFQRYWRTSHADIVLPMAGLRRYVQSHLILSGYSRGEPLHDGMAEVWYDDSAALKANAGSPEYAAVAADEANFMDSSATVLLLTEDHAIIDRPAPEGGVKCVEFLHRREGMAMEDFQAHWRGSHGAIAARIPGIRRYVQSHPKLGGYRDGRQPGYDGAAITWWQSTDAMRAAAGSAELAATRADEANFLRPGGNPTMITKEFVIL
jgi:uncharacterized protein (TIGR02118 family)